MSFGGFNSVKINSDFLISVKCRLQIFVIKRLSCYVWEKVQYGFDSQRDCLLPQNRSVVELLGQKIDLKINRLIH